MRQDYDLAPILQYENIAWFENGRVRILDRRIYVYHAFQEESCLFSIRRYFYSVPLSHRFWPKSMTEMRIKEIQVI